MDMWLRQHHPNFENTWAIHTWRVVVWCSYNFQPRCVLIYFKNHCKGWWTYFFIHRCMHPDQTYFIHMLLQHIHQSTQPWKLSISSQGPLLFQAHSAPSSTFRLQGPASHPAKVSIWSLWNRYEMLTRGLKTKMGMGRAVGRQRSKNIMYGWT
jgi:hypothetical protein